MLELKLVDEGGVKVVEGVPREQLLTCPEDISRVIEACLSTGTRGVLLYAENLSPAFFDLSSGEAGAVLQKLRNYGVTLAVVCTPGSVAFSSRFGEMVAEERRRNDFGLFDTRDAGREWLAVRPRADVDAGRRDEQHDATRGQPSRRKAAS